MDKEEIWEEVKELIIEVSGDESLEVVEDAKLIEDFGFDSVAIMELLSGIDQRFCVDFMDLENFEERFDVCKDLCEGIMELLESKV